MAKPTTTETAATSDDRCGRRVVANANRKHDHDRGDGGGDRHEGGVDGGLHQFTESDATVREAALCPRGEARHRDEQTDRDDERARCERRNRGPPEPSQSPLCHRCSIIWPGDAALGAFECDDGERQQQDDRGRCERQCAVRLAAREDDAGERVVTEQLDRAELAERVEEHEQRPAEDGGAELRKRHPEERRGRRQTEHSATLFEARSETEQARRHGEVDVRIGERSEDEPRGAETPKPIRGRDADGGQSIVQYTAGGEPCDEGRCSDERGQDQRQHEGDAPESTPREVGARRQPRERGPDHRGRDRDEKRQLDRAPQRCRDLGQHVAEVAAEAKGAPDDECGGAGEESTDRQSEQPAGRHPSDGGPTTGPRSRVRSEP